MRAVRLRPTDEGQSLVVLPFPPSTFTPVEILVFFYCLTSSSFLQVNCRLTHLVLVCIAKWTGQPGESFESKQAVKEWKGFPEKNTSAYFARAMRRRLLAITPRPSHRSIPSCP